MPYVSSPADIMPSTSISKSIQSRFLIAGFIIIYALPPIMRCNPAGNNETDGKHHERNRQRDCSMHRMQITHASLPPCIYLSLFHEGSGSAGKHIILTIQEKGRHRERDRGRLIRRGNCTRQHQERPDKNTHAYGYRYDCDYKLGPV